MAADAGAQHDDPVETERDAGAPPTSHHAFLHGSVDLDPFAQHLNGRNMELCSRSPPGPQ
jgi:hypothetical protein